MPDPAGRSNTRARALFILGPVLALAALLFGVGSWLDQTPYVPLAPARAGSYDAPDAGDGFTLRAVAAHRGPTRFGDVGDPSDAGEVRSEPNQRVLSAHGAASLQQTENFLLIGIDKHRGVRRGGRTDTLIVAAFSEVDGQLGLISVPRDLFVDIPGHGQNRINAVWGLSLRARQDPLAALERVVSDTLALPIAHSLAIDLEVFETVIDAVGGVNVEVECPIRDRFLDPRSDGGYRELHLPVGAHQLDGATAGMFIRSRHGRSDFSRTRRQQLVLRALHRELRGAEGLRMLPTVFGIVEESLVSNMSRREILSLARRVLRQDPRKVHGVVLGHAETRAHQTERKWAVLLPDQEAIRARLQGLYSAPAPGQQPAGLECPPENAALVGR